MPHAQQQVLEAIKAAIVAAATNAAGRVFIDRVDALQPGELPAVTVDEGEEGETLVQQTLDGVQLRELNVRVTCIVKGLAAAADARELGLQVERALENDAALANLCAGGFRIQSSKQANSGDGDRLLSGRVQAWALRYSLAGNDPATIFTQG